MTVRRALARAHVRMRRSWWTAVLALCGVGLALLWRYGSGPFVPIGAVGCVLSCMLLVLVVSIRVDDVDDALRAERATERGRRDEEERQPDDGLLPADAGTGGARADPLHEGPGGDAVDGGGDGGGGGD